MRNVIILCMVALGLAACDGPTAPTPIRVQSDLLAWSCYDPTDPHCSNTPPFGDPDSTADGIFLGDFNPEFCFNPSNDDDQDGLDDFCEYQLALSFRPELVTNPYDYDLSGEMYWAARPGGEEGVSIMYMFGYHVDPGNTFSSYCQSDPFNLCGGHFGDSEFANIWIVFNETTEHWEISSMFFGAHYNTGGDSSEMPYGWELEYSAKDLWYPKLYVARDKHGSFPTRSDCNGGGFGSDDCTANTVTGRFDVDYYRNVGSSSNPMISGAVSTIDNPLLYGGSEYFWSSYAFCGWDTASESFRSNCSTPYYTILSDFFY